MSMPEKRVSYVARAEEQVVHKLIALKLTRKHLQPSTGNKK